VTEPHASVRAFRHYRRLIDPAGQPYVVLHYSHLRQAEIDARMAKIRTEVEKWKTELRLSGDDVRKLAWAMSIMQATDAKEGSSHPEVVEHEKLKNAHQRVDEVVQALSNLGQELSLLIEFHRRHRSSSADIFEKLLSLTASYAKARRPAWGSWSRLGIAWHRDAVYFMTILEEAAKRAQTRLSFTKLTSPAVKFISWALDTVGVKHSDEAIRQALVRYRRRQRKPRDKTSAKALTRSRSRRIRRSAFSVSVVRP
jgi:hypothetical protein